MNYEIQELFLYQHAVYKQIVCSSQLIKVKTETKIQIKKKKTPSGKNWKKHALSKKIHRVKIIVKNVGKSNSWSSNPCLSKAEQSRIIRIRQRQWISIRDAGFKRSKFRFRVRSCPRSDFDLNYFGIFMQFVCEHRTSHLNRST